MSGSETTAAVEGKARETAWDDFVAASPQATYLQTSAWARVKVPNGWTAERVEAEGGQGGVSRVGAQVLQAARLGACWG